MLLDNVIPLSSIVLPDSASAVVEEEEEEEEEEIASNRFNKTFSSIVLVGVDKWICLSIVLLAAEYCSLLLPPCSNVPNTAVMLLRPRKIEM